MPKILAGERCNIEGMDGNLLENIVFKSFCSIFRLDGGISRHKCRMEGACMFQGQIGKLLLKSRGNWAIFQFRPIFPLVPP